jgi:cell division protein FtsB
MEGSRMWRKSTLASFVVAVVLSLSLTACKDTKTLQENEQLKTQVADLQKQNGEMGNNLETVTASRDALSKENDDLKSQIATMKSKNPKKKVSIRRHRRR